MKKFLLILFWISCSSIAFIGPQALAQLSSLGPHIKMDTLNLLLSKDKEDTLKVNHLILLSREYSKENADTSYRIALSAYNLAKALHWNKGMGNANIAMGWSLYILGNYDQAMACNFKAKEIGETCHELQIVMYAWSNLGQIYYSQGEINKAIQFNTKALQVAKETKDEWNIARNVGILGSSYQKLKQYPQAMQHYREAYHLTVKIGNTNGSAVWLSNLGSVYLELEKYDSALFYLNKSAGIFDSIGNKWSYAETILDIAKIHTLKERYEEGMELLKKVLHLSVEVGAAECRQLTYLALSELYQKANHDVQDIHSNRMLNKADRQAIALFYYKRFVELKDSLNTRENQKKMLAMEFELKAAATQLEMDKKNATTQAQLKTQKIIRNAFITGSLLLLLLIVLLINRNKLKRKIEMETIRNKLSRDLHDDIGSTLSSINILSKTAQSSLHQTHDEKIKASLEKINERSQRLLHNMSDIIWNIKPGNDQIEDVIIRMREYATTLFDAKNIAYEFNFPKEIMDGKLSMDVKNNVYLIFKEAVNNLCKYSEASKVKLFFSVNLNAIELIVEDNGIGFNEKEKVHTGGLNNMRHRAEELQGNIVIESALGKGTRITLRLPRLMS